MAEERDRNGPRWRDFDDLERRLGRLERFEPAVMARQLADLESGDREVKNQLKWQTRALVGAMLTMLTTLAVVLLVTPHG